MHVQKVFDFCLNKGNHFQTKKSFFPRDMLFTCVTDTVNVVVVTDTCIKSSYFMRRLIILALKFLLYNTCTSSSGFHRYVPTLQSTSGM